jgi:hypothetical protein
MRGFSAIAVVVLGRGHSQASGSLLDGKPLERSRP